MKAEFKICRDKAIEERRVEDLRAAVGWDRLEGKYDKILEKMYTYYVVKSSDSLIGFLGVLSDGIGDAYLIDLIVHPDFQRKKIGTTLVKRAVLDLKAEGIKCIQVIFSANMENFFKRFGFDVLKAGIIDNDKMEVNLESMPD